MNEGVATFIVPITLMLGGGLMAIGLLSLLDLHYFKTSFQGKAALALGLAFLVVTETLFVTSSGGGRYFEGQKADVTQCEFEVERDFPLDRFKKNGVIRDQIKGCMGRLGYEWTAEHDHCREAPLATNTFCYLPTRAFDRALVAFQMKFE
jgi:hypothetical protein